MDSNDSSRSQIEFERAHLIRFTDGIVTVLAREDCEVQRDHRQESSALYESKKKIKPMYSLKQVRQFDVNHTHDDQSLLATCNSALSYALKKINPSNELSRELKP